MVKHGNKFYLQIRLDPAKALLLEQQAQDQGVKTTALPEAINYWLKSVVDPRDSSQRGPSALEAVSKEPSFRPKKGER